MKVEEIEQLKSFRVNANGNLLGIFVVPHGETLIRNAVITQVDEAVLVNNNFGKREVADAVL